MSMPRPYRLIQGAYDRAIRDHLPRGTWVMMNGVPAPSGRPLDRYRVRDWHKSGAIDALRRFTEPTDHVVTIGQAWGTPAIVALRRGHRVTVIEAAGENVEFLTDYFERLHVDDLITVIHGLVAGVDHDVWGADVGDPIHPREIPACDVLDIDTEGAELAILSGLDQRPRVVIAEPHPDNGATEERIRALLGEMGYGTVFRNSGDHQRGKPVIVGTDHGVDTA